MTISQYLADDGLERLLAALAAWLADVWLLGTVLLIVSCGLQLVLRQAALRLAVAWGACLGLIVLALAAGLPLWPRVDALSLWNRTAQEETRVDSHQSATVTTSMEAGLESRRAVLRELSQEARALMASDPAGESAVVWRHPWVLAWILAALGGCTWNLLGGLRMMRLLHRVETAPQWVQVLLTELVGLRRRPRLGTSRQLASAVAVGTLRPRILLPESSVREGQEAVLQAAMAHEWAHIRHGDLWLLAIERLLLPLFGLHPLFWQLRRCARFDQDLLADASAAEKHPIHYAQALLAWTRDLRGGTASRGAPHATLSMWRNPRTLTRRMEMILNAEQRTQVGSSRRALGLMGLMSLLLIGGLSVLTIRPETSTAQEERAASPQDTEAAGTQDANQRLQAAIKDRAETEAQQRNAAIQASDEQKQRLQDLGRFDEAGRVAELQLQDEERLHAELAALEQKIADLRAVIVTLKRTRLAQAAQPPGLDSARQEDTALVKVFRLRYRRSGDVAQLLPLFLPENSLARVAADAGTNSVIVKASESELNNIAEAIDHLDALAAAHAAEERAKQAEDLAEEQKMRAEQEARAAQLAADQAAKDEALAREAAKRRRPSPERQQLELELLSLDVAEAEAKLEHALEESKVTDERAQTGVVSPSEVAQKHQDVRLAEIALKRARLKLRSAELDLQEEPDADPHRK